MPGILPNILGIIENWGMWSEMVAVKLPDITSESITFENMLSVSVLEWLVLLVGCEITGTNDFEARESKNLLSHYSQYNSRG